MKIINHRLGLVVTGVRLVGKLHGQHGGRVWMRKDEDLKASEHYRSRDGWEEAPSYEQVVDIMNRKSSAVEHEVTALYCDIPSYHGWKKMDHERSVEINFFADDGWMEIYTCEKRSPTAEGSSG